MNKELESKIKRIADAQDDTPNIFKVVLKKELALVAQEEILDVVLIKREYTDNVKKTSIFSKAVMLIATNFGIVTVEDGLNDAQLEFGGYRIRHVMYSKIKCLDFNSCLLVGYLKVVTGSSNEPDLSIEFNSSKYYTQLDQFVYTIRGKMIDLERKFAI
jgi:hypothetical protein